MISPGQWHKSVPRDLEGNLRFRKWLLEQCRDNPEYRDAVWQGCKRDLIFFLRCFIVQYNPLLKGDRIVGPFIDWQFQEEALLGPKGIVWCYEHDRTAVVEKSRDMGASWLFLIFQLWLAIFHDNVALLNISRNAEAVDSASDNALFPKIRFMLEHLPDWLTGKVDQVKMTFKFRRTRSEIAGQASTGDAGVGGRASVVFVDEYSKIKEDTKVRQGTASTTECRFFNGTHEGVSTEFYNLTEDARKLGEIILIQMHWTRHPRKNQFLYSWDTERQEPVFWKYDPIADDLIQLSSAPPGFPEDHPFDRTGAPTGGPHPGIRSVWYDKKAGETGSSRAVAMELDINPSGSSSQFYEALMIRRLVQSCREPVWTGTFHYDREAARPMEFEPKDTGSLRLWIEPDDLNPEGRLNRVRPARYVIGCDLGTGLGATPSCLSIFDQDRGIKVGMWENAWVQPGELGGMAVALARCFRDEDGEPAFLIWECPGPGLAFGNAVVKDHRFLNVYWRVVNLAGLEERPSDIPGFYANNNSQRELHESYSMALRQGDYVNWEEKALKQTLGYIYHGNTVTHPKAKANAGRVNDPAAEGLNHGDLVVADALTWFAAKKRTRPVEREKVVEVALPNSIQGRRLYNRQREREAAGIWG